MWLITYIETNSKGGQRTLNEVTALPPAIWLRMNLQRCTLEGGTVVLTFAIEISEAEARELDAVLVC